MRHLWRVPLILAAALTMAAGSRPTGGGLSEAAKPGLQDFKVQTLDGQPVSLSRYRGKIVILDLFATWCPPCRMEIPQFVELQKEYADRLAVVGLSFDQGSVDTIRRFLKEMKINYDVYLGSDEIAEYVDLRFIPFTLVLDQEGRVIRTHRGFAPKSEFVRDILALSRPAAVPTAEEKKP